LGVGERHGGSLGGAQFASAGCALGFRHGAVLSSSFSPDLFSPDCRGNKKGACRESAAPFFTLYIHYITLSRVNGT
jgi:hypothetical protein